MDSTVQLIADLNQWGAPTSVAVSFYTMATARGYTRFAKSEWRTTPGEPLALQDFDCKVLHHARTGLFEEPYDFLLLEREGLLVHIWGGAGQCSVVAACSGSDLAPAEKFIKRLREIMPPNPPPPDDSIYLTFWALGPQGPMRVQRRIVIPSWEDIGMNYPTPTGEKLEQLMLRFTPSTGGQLLLLHGIPGTGKTYAIRALGRAWRDWCSFEYVTDPEAFFGDAGYMMNVLLQLGGDGAAVVAIPAPSGSAPKRETPREKWQLLILEDTGELLTSDAKVRSGQGLSRFLNLADGLIGQGLNLLILVTTNEPLQSLHDAVQRPGRCAANIEFARFPQEAGRGWLSDHDCDHDPGGNKTLADLYGILAGREVDRIRPMGLGV